MSKVISPLNSGNYYDPNQVIYNETNYESLPNPPDQPSSGIWQGVPSKHTNDPAFTYPAPTQPTNLAFVDSSGIQNPQAALVTTKDGSRQLSTVNTSPISNASIFPRQNFTQGNYIHYTPNPKAGEGEVDKVPAAVDFDPSIVIQSNTTPYYRYG